MTDAYIIGAMKTDSLTGRVLKAPQDAGVVLATVTGRAMKIGGSDYRVTLGKTFYITGIILSTRGATSAGTTILTYADDAAQTTNRVSLGFTYPGSLAATIFIQFVIPFFSTVPSQKYLGNYNAGAGNDAPGMIVLGYEE